MCDLRVECSYTNISRRMEERDREGEVPMNFMRWDKFMRYCSRSMNLEASETECVNLAEMKQMDHTQSITGSVSLKFRWMIAVRYPWWSKKVFELDTGLKTIFELESISGNSIL